VGQFGNSWNVIGNQLEGKTSEGVQRMENRCVRFDLPFPLLLPDSLEGDCPDEADDLAPEVLVKAKVSGGIRTRLVFETVAGVTARGVLKGGDPYGRVSYSRVQVRFHIPTNPEAQDWSDDGLIENAVDLVNKVVSGYRAISGQPLLKPLSPVDLVHFQVLAHPPGGSPFWRRVLRGRGPLEVGLNQPQLDLDKKLRAHLLAGEGVPFLRDIELNPFADLYVRDFRLAVVEAETFFEAWLGRKLKAHFKDLGLSEEEVSKKFRPKGQFKSITWITNNLVPDAWGRDFKETAERDRWAKYCRDLRNEIVHGNKEEVSEAEGRSAIDAVKDACGVISRFAEEWCEA
jgi:hypothetical protein